MVEPIKPFDDNIYNDSGSGIYFFKDRMDAVWFGK